MIINSQWEYVSTAYDGATTLRVLKMGVAEKGDYGKDLVEERMGQPPYSKLRWELLIKRPVACLACLAKKAC
jgi:hypothetical protein